VNALLTDNQSLPGFQVRKLRVSRMLTRQELAQMAGVSPEDVDLVENDLPVPSETMLDITGALRVSNANGAERILELTRL